VIAERGRTFTDEQQRAIADDAGDLLLSAAAGSGKTSVLVERFASHVRGGIAPGRILAITFTEKAAGELKARVRRRLLELGERDAAREAEGAWISTIHGFCARLLRSHAVAAGIDPRFAVLDEPVTRTLQDAAWEEAFAGWLDDRGAAALDLAAAFTTDRLRLAITDVHDALRSAGATRPSLPAPAPIAEPDPARLLRARDEAAAALAGAANGKTLEKALAALERCRELFDGGAAPEPGALAAAAFKAGNTKALKTAPCEAYLEAHQAYVDAVVGRRAVAAAAELDALLGRYADAYAEAKRARSGLDFDDLELLARDLLRDQPAVRAAYRERFERVLVDEFQDSNPLQLELFDLLGAGNVFLVGDELQSIYGFRHADVDVFRRRRDMLEADGRALALRRNFRSHPAVLDVVNAAFPDRPLVAGREEGASAPRVELLLTTTTGWEEAGLDLGELPRSQAWRHAEARVLAQRIRDLVDAGDHGPEDVVVLLRGLGDLPVYERALEDAGLQTLATGGRGYWGRQVVRDLCAWLAALANPRDELALFGVLASPLVGASTDALALIAEAGRGNAWRAIAAGDERVLGRLDPGDRERLAAFRERFARERELAPRLALDEVLRRAVEATDYDLHVLRLPGGARRLANLHKLLRLAADHERAHGRDVRGLVDRATAELEADAREADAPVELGDAKAVRLMTIHAAKGLEFPVVCVADLGRRTSVDAPAVLVDGPRLGIRLPALDGSSSRALDYDALRDRRRDADAAEERRIMYVALTRAEERLILSGGVDPEKWPAETMGAAPLSWLGPALLGAGCAALPGEEEPDVTVGAGDGRLRVALNTPATVGRVLRPESLAPAGAALPRAPEPPAKAPLPVAPGPAATVRTLSYSSLSQWGRCGYRFYLERILRLPPEEGGRVPARTATGGLEPRLRGTLAHEALELGGPPDEAIAGAADRHGVELTAEERDDLVGMVAGFARTALARRVDEAQRVKREHPFAFPLGDSLLNGIVDVHATEHDGSVLVVDYKTDRVDDGDLAALVERDYAVQRRVYALAALEDGAPRVEVAYAFLERPGEPVVAAFTPADAGRLRRELEHLAEGVLAGDFEVSDTPHIGLCAGCPGRRALCRHDEALTGRELPLAG
jgi:ATP-dependent exoDNAse (exonuclease V) beta subunit